MGESFKKKEKEICFPCDICSPSLVFSGPSRYHFRKLLTFTLNACFRCEKYSTSFLRRVGRKKQLGMIHGADGKELTKTQSPQEHRNISRVQLGQKPPPPSFQPPCQLHCGGGGGPDSRDRSPGELSVSTTELAAEHRRGMLIIQFQRYYELDRTL